VPSHWSNLWTVAAVVSASRAVLTARQRHVRKSERAERRQRRRGSRTTPAETVPDKFDAAKTPVNEKLSYR